MTTLKLMRTSLLIILFVIRAFAEDHYLLRTSPSAVNQIVNRYGVRLVNSLSGSGQGLYVVGIPDGSNTTAVVAALQADPLVQSIEHDDPMAVAEATQGPDPRPHFGSVALNSAGQSYYYYNSVVWGAYTDQPAAALIRTNDAHRFATGSGIVAILDTGADFSHPVLAGSLIPGFDFTRNWAGGSDAADLYGIALADQSTTPILDQSTTPILDDSVVVNQSTTPILDDDDSIVLGQSTTPILDGYKAPHAYGHGTMVAGLIHLVAPTAALMPVKVFSSDGTSSISLIVNGIYYAVDHGAKVINMSFELKSTSPELTNAINYAYAHNVIMVASAGNEGQALVVYPASYTQVTGVGSVNNNDLRSVFSNYGSVVNVAAPGEALVTTYPLNHYALGWGTSFSTPLVSGAAALLVNMNPNINQSQAQTAIFKANAVGQGLGAGVLDLFQACFSFYSGGLGNN